MSNTATKERIAETMNDFREKTGIREIKVFQMNEFDSVSARSIDEAIKFYNENSGTDSVDKAEVKEVNYKSDGLWLDFRDYELTIEDILKKFQNKQLENFNIKYTLGAYRFWVSYDEFLRDYYEFFEPEIVASTEY